MAHIIIKDAETGEVEGVLCIERQAQSCIILTADEDRLSELVNIARAQKVPKVRIIMPRNAVHEMEALGWQEDKNVVVMTNA